MTRCMVVSAVMFVVLLARGIPGHAAPDGVSVWEDTFANTSRISEMNGLRVLPAGGVELGRAAPDGPHAYGAQPNTVTTIPVVISGTTYDVAFPQVQGTVELWVRGDFTSHPWVWLMDYYNQTRSRIFFRTITGTVNAQVAFQSPGGYVLAHQFSLSDTDWNFVVIQWDCVAGWGRIYLNGNLLKEKAITDPQWRPSEQVFRLVAPAGGGMEQVRLLSTILDGGTIADDYASLHEMQGEMVSVPVVPIAGLTYGWHEAQWDAALPVGTAFIVQIEHFDGAQWVPVPDADLPGNSGGLSGSPVDLSGLDAGTYPKLRMRGRMSTQDPTITGQLQSWRLCWKYDLGPHPRVYLRAADLPALRQKYNDAGSGVLGPAFKTLHTDIQNAQFSDLNPAFLYLMTGDATHATRAINKALGEVAQVDGCCGNITSTNPSQKYWYAAITYDWCYDRLTQVQKDTFLAEFERIRNIPSPGHLSSGSMVNGHYVGSWLQNGHVTSAVAIHDEDTGPLMQYGREYFDLCLPFREFIAPSGTHHQGNSYGKFHQMADYAAALLWRHLGLGDVLPVEYPPYQMIYNRRPDGRLFHLGDGISGWDGGAWSWSCLAVSYYRDPFLVNMMDHDHFLDWWDPPWVTVFAMIGRDPAVQPRPFEELPLTGYFPAPVGPNMIARTGWTLGADSPDAVVQMRIGNRFFANHQQYDFGIFQIYYRGILAMTSGGYAGFDADGNPRVYGCEHWKHYHRQTISQNGLLIHDPAEENVLLGSVLANVGGQYGDGNTNTEHGVELAHAAGPDPMAPDYSYLSGDITKAYVNNKAARVTRSMVTLNTFNQTYPCAFVVFDRVVSTDASFKKTWLIHSMQEPAIDGKTITIVNTGTSPGPGKSQTDGPPYNGKLVVESLLPGVSSLTPVGGPGKEWWIESTQTNYVTTSTIEPGAWRVEVSPSTPALSDLFLHAMTVMDADTATAPAMERIDAADMVGVQVLDRTVLFGRDETALTSAAFTLTHAGTNRILVCDLAPGLWSVRVDGVETARNLRVTSKGRCLYISGMAGAYTLTRTMVDDDGDTMPDAWEIANGLDPIDPADATLDGDHDGMQNLAEYIAGTNPQDANSVLTIKEIVKTDPGVIVKFDSVAGRLYDVEYSDDPAAGGWTVLQSDIPGTGVEIETSDPANPAKRLYRVKVRMP